MPNDAFTLSFLAKELNSMLVNGKVNKINMPEKDELVLNIYKDKTNYKLLLSCNANMPRVHITSLDFENPLTCPSICMSFRKHLSNAKIIDICQRDFERQIVITFLAKNEMFDEIKLFLIVEIMGKYSNIILVNEANKIMLALKTVTFDVSSVRQVLSGLEYSMPPKQDKISPYDFDGILNSLESFEGVNLSKFLSNTLQGISDRTANEIVFLSNLNNNKPLEINEKKILIDTIKSVLGRIEKQDYSPVISLNESGKPIDFYAFEYKSVNGIYNNYPTLSEAIDKCYYLKEKHSRFDEKSKVLQNIVKNEIKKLEKKLGIYLDKKLSSQNYEVNKEYGDLILSNIYKIKKGDKVLKTANFFKDNEEIEIPLDLKFSPSDNAKQYFKKYTKQKRTYTLVDSQIEEINSNIDYLNSIMEAFRKCTEIVEINEIKQELIAEKFIKEKKINELKTNKKSEPLTYSFNGYKILVGKNNVQNDHLTMKIAKPHDMWLHTKDIHGSHVIIVNESEKEIPIDVIEFASELASYYSKGYMSNKVQVDYTYRKFIKKPSKAKPGFVIYTNQKSAFVTPNGHLENKIK